MHSLSDHTKTFLNRFFKSASDSHYFTNRFHGRTQFFINPMEFTQIPTRNLTYDIIQCRFEESGSSLGYRVLQVEEPITQSQFGSNESQRITGCFGCQSGRTGKTGVHFNNPIIFGFGIEGILYITFTHNTNMADDTYSQLAKFMVFFIRKRLGWSNNDRLTGMDTQRIEVFHITNGDTVIETVTYHFIFHFFPAAK